MARRLNPKQELFCKLYATDHFGNGVRAYAEAYGKDLGKSAGYNTARTNSHTLLTNPAILARINELIDKFVLSDEAVDRELAFVIQQKAEFGPKVAAIKEYNALKQRVTKKLDITSGGKPLPIMGGTSVSGDHGLLQDSGAPETD